MTTYGIKGQWIGELNINGQPVAIDTMKIFKEITIRSHVHMDLPSLTLSFADSGGEVLNKVQLSDGMTVTCGMGDGHSDSVDTQEFLTIGNPQVAPDDNSSSLQVTQVCTLNKPKWGRKIVDKHYEGNTHEVISQLAQDAGLTAETDSTQDKQTWLPNGRSLVSYARFVAERGYIDSSSAMIMAVTEGGKLLYKNVSKIAGSGSGGKVISNVPDDNGIPYLEFMVASKGKVYNAVRGYGSTTAQDPGTGDLTKLSKLTTDLMSGIDAIGAAFQGAVGDLGTRVEYSPIDSGNVHAKYMDAKHQNRRIKGLYSEDIKVMFDRESNMELMDKVSFKPVEPNTGEPLSNYVGEYIVTGKVRSLSHNKYLETLTLTSQGISAGGSS